MRVLLKGIHTVRKRLADGSSATYYYAWRGGPRLEGVPGSPEFVTAFAKAHAGRRTVAPGSVSSLIVEYRGSSDFKGLRDATRRDYARYLGKIEVKFGTMPLEVVEDPRSRRDFKVWRDSMAETPRAADLAWSVLARVFSFAKDRGLLSVNPCERGGRLYSADRNDAIWTEDLIARALASFPDHLRWALILALWTGQRQGDLLRLPWSAFDGSRITLRQRKRGKSVMVPVGSRLTLELAGIPRVGPIILTSSDQRPWTSSGFRASWRRACARAGIAGVTFHDLRGSAVTRMAEAGATSAEIASITGHSLKDVEGMLDAAYLSRTNALAESAIRKLERRTDG